MQKKHGPDVTDLALKQRAIDGASPITGKKWSVNCSAQFVSWRANMDVLNEATPRETRNMPRFTGEDAKGNLVVRMEAPKIGRGYIPNKDEPGSPVFFNEMNKFEVKFDYETLRPISAYPIGEI